MSEKYLLEKYLLDLLKRLLNKLPHKTRDASVGNCAGCGALLWCGDGKGREPCKDDCVLQEALMVVKENE